MTKLLHFSNEHLIVLAQRATASAVWALLDAEKSDKIALLHDQHAMKTDTEGKRRNSSTRLMWRPEDLVAACERQNSEKRRRIAAQAKELVPVILSRDTNAQLPVCRESAEDWCDFMYFVAFDQELPTPSAVKNIDDLRLPRVNECDIGLGDYCICFSPCNSENYIYSLIVFYGGDYVRPIAFGSDIKRQIGAAIHSGSLNVDRAIMKGRGPLAGIVRRIHAERAGFLAEGETESSSTVAEVFDRETKRLAEEEAQAELQFLARIEADGCGDVLRSLDI